MNRTRDEWLADGAACLEAARQYLGWGWSVIPLCPPDHIGVGRHHGGICDSPGKTPLLSWKAYQTQRPTLVDLDIWWKQWPNANVGIVMGEASGLIGLDLEGAGGHQRLAQLTAALAVDTLEFVTPGGGRRFLFRVGSGKQYRIAYENFSTKDELRVLGQGAQTVAPPSRHHNGGYYRWSSTPMTPGTSTGTPSTGPVRKS